MTVLYIHSKTNRQALENISGAADVLRAYGWRIQVILAKPQPPPIGDILDFWHPLGCIVDCGLNFNAYLQADFGRVPVVFLHTEEENRRKDAMFVYQDQDAVARAAAHELLSLGFVHFAFVPYMYPHLWSKKRGTAFMRAIKLNGLTCHPFPGVQPSNDGELGIQNVLLPWLKELPKPCGIFAANDYMAVQVADACALAGIDVPEDISIVGVDDDKTVCERNRPTLTSVHTDLAAAGRVAAELLAIWIRNPSQAAETRTFGPPWIVRRESTRLLSKRDRGVSDALNLIRTKACAGLSAADVANTFPCSRRMAELRFRKATGHSILQEIHEIRFEKAQSELLRMPHRSISAIANFCGYGNADSFCRFFRETTGMSPTAWRRSQKRI
jgi:LacI family transcriptional regulator